MTPDNIKKLRKSLDLTQPKFAELLGFKCWETVSRLENGHSTPDKSLIFMLNSLKQNNKK